MPWRRTRSRYLQAEFIRVGYPLYSATPGWAEESRRFRARMIKNPEVAAHYDSHEVLSFDPRSLLGAVRCPVLILAGEGDPVCPLPVVEELAGRLPADTTRLVCGGASHHLPRPPGPRLSRTQDLCRPDRESHPAS